MRLDRKRLFHDPPNGLPDGEIYFITICCDPRGRNQLARDETFFQLIDATRYYVVTHHWFVHLMLAMPDHLHALISFSHLQKMDRIVRDWKRWTSKSAGIKWQDGFFDHRLRSDESFDEKAAYIRLNPVRAAFCSEEKDWPFLWVPVPHPAR